MVFNPKLFFKLEKYATESSKIKIYGIEFIVIYMDNRFRCTPKTKKQFKSEITGWKILSSPKGGIEIIPSKRQITLKSYYDSDDNCQTIEEFNDEKERDIVYLEILKTLEDWSRNYKGWKKENKDIRTTFVM